MVCSVAMPTPDPENREKNEEELLEDEEVYVRPRGRYRETLQAGYGAGFFLKNDLDIFEPY